VLAALTTGLLIAVAAWGISFSAERYVLDRLRDTPRIAPEAGIAMLEQAIRANPWNHASHYQLAAALAQPGERFDYDRSLREVEAALRLNPNYALGYALRALLEDQRGKVDEAEADIEHALRLDPWNYPEHYFYYAVIARDDETKRTRLLEGITKIGVAEPVLASGIRPDWVRLNGLFARWYYVLASLTKDKREAATYRERAARFEQAAQTQRNQDAAARGEPPPPGSQGT
jgi:tetratricopeptide (TPR) repeat protein